MRPHPAGFRSRGLPECVGERGLSRFTMSPVRPWEGSTIGLDAWIGVLGGGDERRDITSVPRQQCWDSGIAKRVCRASRDNSRHARNTGRRNPVSPLHNYLPV